jgi:hypothetical protein
LDFTGATATECYTIINKINATPTDGGNPISSYPNCADCIDGTTTTYTISGCTTLNVLVADLGPGAFGAGDIFNMTFTGATPSGCYRIVNKIVATPTDTGAPLTFYFNCDDCEASLVTPTPTPTVTPTPTSTLAGIQATIEFSFFDNGSGVVSASMEVISGVTLDSLSWGGIGIGYSALGCSGTENTQPFSDVLGIGDTQITTEVWGSISAILSAQNSTTTFIVNGNTINTVSQIITVGGHNYVINGVTNCFSPLI